MQQCRRIPQEIQELDAEKNRSGDGDENDEEDEDEDKEEEDADGPLTSREWFVLFNSTNTKKKLRTKDLANDSAAPRPARFWTVFPVAGFGCLGTAFVTKWTWSSNQLVPTSELHSKFVWETTRGEAGEEVHKPSLSKMSTCLSAYSYFATHG